MKKIKQDDDMIRSDRPEATLSKIVKKGLSGEMTPDLKSE